MHDLQTRIRRAEINDCTAMMKLIHELAEYEKAPEEVTVEFDHFVDAGFGPNPVWWAFVAETTQGGESFISGFALYYIRYSTWKGRRLYLEDLIVTESMRGKGIGALLFDQLLAECKEKKFNGMMWQVLHWNEPAIRFYKKYNADFDEGWVNCSIKNYEL